MAICVTMLQNKSPAMTLQGPETFEFVPNSQFTVSRTAHRNNSSDYFIDDKKSNFTEVTKLLKSKGIDLDNNRFLILQVCLDNVPAFVCAFMQSILPFLVAATSHQVAQVMLSVPFMLASEHAFLSS